MTQNSKVLWVTFALLIAVSAEPRMLTFWELLTPHSNSNGPVLGIGVGLITFFMSLLLEPRLENKLFYNLGLPLIFAFLYSLFPLASEFDPDNISKGFGIIYFVIACMGSAIGTAAGLFVGRNIREIWNRRTQ